MSEFTPPSTKPPSPLPRLAGLAWVIVFVLWFYSLTMPNAQTLDGTTISRFDLWTNLSDLLMENIFPTPNAGAPPSGWRYFPQRFDLMAVAAFILAGAWGLGHLLLRIIGGDVALKFDLYRFDMRQRPRINLDDRDFGFILDGFVKCDDRGKIALRGQQFLDVLLAPAQESALRHVVGKRFFGQPDMFFEKRRDGLRRGQRDKTVLLEFLGHQKGFR